MTKFAIGTRRRDRVRRCNRQVQGMLGRRHAYMTRHTAEAIVEQLLLASSALNEALVILDAEGHDEAQDPLFLEHRVHTANVLASIYLDLIKPVVRPFPDLDPGRSRSGTSR